LPRSPPSPPIGRRDDAFGHHSNPGEARNKSLAPRRPEGRRGTRLQGSRYRGCAFGSESTLMDGIPAEDEAAMGAAGEVTGPVEAGAWVVAALSTARDTAAPVSSSNPPHSLTGSRPFGWLGSSPSSPAPSPANNTDKPRRRRGSGPSGSRLRTAAFVRGDCTAPA
jgi:hypothetical protein